MTISRKEFDIYARMLESIRREAEMIRTAWPWQWQKKNGALRRASKLLDVLGGTLADRVSKPRKKPEPTP